MRSVRETLAGALFAGFIQLACLLGAEILGEFGEFESGAAAEKQLHLFLLPGGGVCTLPATFNKHFGISTSILTLVNLKTD